jgi:hypothetical protein
MSTFSALGATERRAIGPAQRLSRQSLYADADAARDIVRKTGQRGVPVIKIGGRWIVGFDKEQIEKALAREAS